MRLTVASPTPFVGAWVQCTAQFLFKGLQCCMVRGICWTISVTLLLDSRCTWGRVLEKLNDDYNKKKEGNIPNVRWRDRLVEYVEDFSSSVLRLTAVFTSSKASRGFVGPPSDVFQPSLSCCRSSCMLAYTLDKKFERTTFRLTWSWTSIEKAIGRMSHGIESHRAKAH